MDKGTQGHRDKGTTKQRDKETKGQTNKGNSQPLGKTKKSRNLLEQKKMQPIRIKNHATSQDKENPATS